MNQLRPGDQVMQGGRAIELLWEVRPGVWMVKPLFVAESLCEVRIREGERCTKLHSQTRRA